MVDVLVVLRVQLLRLSQGPLASTTRLLIEKIGCDVLLCSTRGKILASGAMVGRYGWGVSREQLFSRELLREGCRPSFRGGCWVVSV